MEYFWVKATAVFVRLRIYLCALINTNIDLMGKLTKQTHTLCGLVTSILNDGHSAVLGTEVGYSWVGSV